MNIRSVGAKIVGYLPQSLTVATYVLRYTVFRPKADVNALKKQETVISYLKKYRIKSFVETGTCFGEMVYAVRDAVDMAYSIEIDNRLFKIASWRFAFNPKIRIILGDSARVLNELLPTIDHKYLIWLDAHYSGGITGRGPLATPILQELEAIKLNSSVNPLILIDDLRCFGSGDYPPVEEACDAIKAIDARYDISVRQDILRAVPPGLDASGPSLSKGHSCTVAYNG